jgi:hypothetical protein
MSDLLSKLSERGISDSSFKLYSGNLKKLNDGKAINSLNFLSNIHQSLEKIKHLKPNTQRSYLIAIVSLLSALKDDDKEANKLYDEYYPLLKKSNDELRVNNVKSDSQRENWVSQDDINRLLEQKANEVVSFLSKKQLTSDEYNKLLSFVVLALFTLQAPRRNLDYQVMYVVKSLPKNMDMRRNYLTTKDWTFHFNNYKTAGTYKTQTEAINESMQDVLRQYLRFHPLRGQLKGKDGAIPLLVFQDGQPLSNRNAITYILNKVFNKKVGSSMLRNISSTTKFAPLMNELQKQAEQMGTSAEQLLHTYIKKD